VARPELLGREAELELIVQRVADAHAGMGGLVVVCGEPGIGKTRLLSEAVAIARAAGMVAAWGRCREDGGAPPFLPWTQILRAAIEETGADLAELQLRWPEVASLMQPLTTIEVTEPSARFRLLSSVTETLAHLGQAGGLLAVVDDLHRADHASMSVLAHLAADLQRVPLLVVAAYRDTDVPPGASFGDDLARVLETSGATLLKLHGLGAAQVIELIDRYAGPVDADTAHTVADRTNGNPFFVIEVAMLLRAASDPAAVATEGLPPTVQALIAGRFARLPGETRAAMEAAAVLGRDFGRLPLAEMLGSGEIAVAAALQPAASTGLIAPGPAGTYRFTHALVQSAIYGSLTVERRAALHRRAAAAIATALDHNDAVDHDAAEEERISDLAFHSYHAAIDGDLGVALQHTLAAGRRAARRLAFDESVLWLSRALELAERRRVPPDEFVDILLELGDAERDAGRTSSARRTYERGAALARRVGLIARFARCALGVGKTVVTAGRVDWDLVALLEEAALCAESDAERALIESRLAIELYWHEGGEPSRRMSATALTRAERSGDPAAVGVALHSRQFTLRGPDHLQERIAIGERLVTTARDSHQLDLEFQGRVWLAADVLRAADVPRFRRLVEALASIATRTRLPLQRWYALVMRGQLASVEGSVGEAFQLIEEAAVLGARLEVELARPYRLGQRCVLCRERDGLDAIADDIDQLARELPYFVTIRSFAALAAATTGHARAARLQIEQLSGDSFAAVPRDSLWVATIALLTEAAAISGSPHTGELLSLLHPHGGTLVVNGVPNCWGSADRFLGRACLALGQLDQSEHHLTAAVALETAAGLPIHLARTRLDQARLALAQHDSQRAGALIAQVRDLAGALDLNALDREASSLLPEPGPRLVLTKREQEVLEHISRGDTNKEIAASLVISLNTVERHLANIYTKLGIRGRAEAAAYAVRVATAPTSQNGGLP